jgi:hypothetical protein
MVRTKGVWPVAGLTESHLTYTVPDMSSAPGWYEDPTDSRLLRWWTGTDWTGHVHDPRTASVLPDPFYIPPVPPPARTAPRRAVRTLRNLTSASTALLGILLFGFAVSINLPLSGGLWSTLTRPEGNMITTETCMLLGERLSGAAPDSIAYASASTESAPLSIALYEDFLGVSGVFLNPGCTVDFLVGPDIYNARVFLGKWDSTVSVRDSLESRKGGSMLTPTGSSSVIGLSAPAGLEAYLFEFKPENDPTGDYQLIYILYPSGTIAVYEPWYSGSPDSFDLDVWAIAPLFE